jgi:hypothetical protein
LPAGSHQLSKAILNRVCAFAQQGQGLRVFPYVKGIISRSTFLHRSNVQCNCCSHTPHQPAKTFSF